MSAAFLNRLSGTRLEETLEETILRNLRTLLNTSAPLEHIDINRRQAPLYITSTLNYGLPDVVWQNNSIGDTQQRACIKKNILATIRAFEPRLQTPELEWSHTQNDNEAVLSFILTGHINRNASRGTEKARLTARVWCDGNGRFYLK